MRELAQAGREISWQLDDTLRRAESLIAGPRRRSAGTGRSTHGGSIVLRDGEVDLSVDADPGSDASLAFRLAAVAAYTGVPMRDVRSDQAARQMRGPDDPWADEVRNALLALLGGGHAMIPLFETLDRYGLIARAIRSGTPCGASHSATPSIGTPLIAICSKPWRRPPGSRATSCGPTCFS